MYIFQRIFLLRTACFSFPFNLSCLEREKYFKIENKSIKKMTLYLFLFFLKIFSFEIKASVVKWKYLLYFLTHSSVSEMESRIQWGGGMMRIRRKRKIAFLERCLRILRHLTLDVYLLIRITENCRFVIGPLSA